MNKLQILMPVYNEAQSIEDTIKEIYDTLNGKIEFQFIISEDGSSDGTKEILKKLKDVYPMILISDNNRKYYSKAVIDGIKKADADYLLIKDSDGQCDPKDILNFWNLIAYIYKFFLQELNIHLENPKHEAKGGMILDSLILYLEILHKI